MNRALGRLLALALFVLPARLVAQDATAEELYRQGVAEFQKGNYDAACQAFAQSYAAEPLPGALFTLATCEMRAGRLATAAARYQEFLSLVEGLPSAQRAAQKERSQVARRERDALLLDVPYLRIVASPRLLERAAIKLDGRTLERAELGVELAVDPGERVVAVEATDGTRTETRVPLARREHKSVVLSPVAMAPGRVETTSDVPRRAAPPPAAPAEERVSVTPWPAYVALGVGVAGVAVGSVAGLRALDHKGVVDDECDGPACTARGKEEADAASTAALVSTVGFGVGAAGLTTALVLFLTAGGRDRTARRVGSAPVTVGWRSIRIAGAF